MSESGRVPFTAHIELLRFFLAQREAIVERIQGLLNAQARPVQHQEDRPLLSRQFEDCFFTLPAISREQASLKGQLQQAHWAEGFRPRDMPGIPNEMFDPADMMTRAFRLWRHTRWPGRKGRVRYAHTLFNLYLVRCLALLDMRLWDAGPEPASERLAQVRGLLDQLWKTSPPDQPVLVRDARWLVPVAQSPTTDELGPYFEVARKITESLPEADRLEIHQAAVLMAGGHLRSQLRHFNMQGTPLADAGLLLRTRRSNALDCAMTIQSLVPLLKAYEAAVQGDDSVRRARFADVICQGISPDPELYVNRLDLLGSYSMIEHLFIAAQDGRVAYTPMGARHVALLQEYIALMERLWQRLHEDCTAFRPVSGAYSPYGVMYGFSSNLMEHMAMKALQPEAETRFSLEDVFVGEGEGAQRLAWVSGWRQLPHMPAEVQKLYEYPQQFAEQVFDRVEQALRRRASDEAPARTGRLFIIAGDDARLAAQAAEAGELPARYLLSPDAERVAAQKATACEQAQLLADRREGEFLLSYQAPGGWVAISKDLLTEQLGAGHDVKISGLPAEAATTLVLMCPGLQLVH